MHRFSLYLALVIFSGTLEADSLHPLVKLENIYPSNKVELKISAMAFRVTISLSRLSVPIVRTKPPSSRARFSRSPPLPPRTTAPLSRPSASWAVSTNPPRSPSSTASSTSAKRTRFDHTANVTVKMVLLGLGPADRPLDVGIFVADEGEARESVIGAGDIGITCGGLGSSGGVIVVR